MRALSPIIVIALLLGFVANLCFFTVDESERALVFRLGKIKRVTGGNQADILRPGLKFKFPLIDTVRYFDARLQLLDIPSSRILTKEKKIVIVDLFVQWKIRDFDLFFTRVGGLNRQAELLLQQTLIDAVRGVFGSLTIKESVSDEREQLMNQITNKVSNSNNIKDLGIEVIDVRVKQINLPPEVSGTVYDRMRTEREQVAKQLRATGSSEAEKLRAKAEGEARVILAEAQKEGQTLKGEGDAEAAQTYAKTYNQAPDFYEFYRSMDAYKRTFGDKRDVFVLKPDSQFFKYMKGLDGK